MVFRAITVGVVLGGALLGLTGQAAIGQETSLDAKTRCGRPEVTRKILDAVSAIETKTAGRHIEAVDVVGMNTVEWNSLSGNIKCHGTFLLSDGSRQSGTLFQRNNAVGEAVTGFVPDKP